MSTCNRWAVFLVGGLLAAWAQEGASAPSKPASSLKINFPKDSPITLLSADLGESRTDARGGALVLDLHTALTLRNSSHRRIRGVTLLVQAQELAPGGKASVAVPSLDVRPGETFPLRIDLRLLRPLMTGGGPLAEVSLDGVLFDDLSFYGPDRLDSQRSMTVWELEARRDRRYFKSVLEAKGREGLRSEILDTLARLANHPQLDVQVVRRGRAVAMTLAGRQCQLAFLQIPGAPLDPIGGLAQVVGNETSSPHVQVMNRSGRAIRYFEIGWIIKDHEGREFLAGSVPVTEAGVKLAPGAKSEVFENAWLRFTQQTGQPVSIDSMTGFVSQVEFTDGTIWIPNRASLAAPRMRAALAPSPEEQRLADLYRTRGLKALVNELKKF